MELWKGVRQRDPLGRDEMIKEGKDFNSGPRKRTDDKGSRGDVAEESRTRKR